MTAVVSADVSRRSLVALLAALAAAAGVAVRRGRVGVDGALVPEGLVAPASVSTGRLTRAAEPLRGLGTVLAPAPVLVRVPIPIPVPVTSPARVAVTALSIGTAAAPVAGRVPSGRVTLFGPPRLTTASSGRLLPSAATRRLSTLTGRVRFPSLAVRMAGRSRSIVGVLAARLLIVRSVLSSPVAALLVDRRFVALLSLWRI